MYDKWASNASDSEENHRTEYKRGKQREEVALGEVVASGKRQHGSVRRSEKWDPGSLRMLGRWWRERSCTAAAQTAATAHRRAGGGAGDGALPAGDEGRHVHGHSIGTGSMLGQTGKPEVVQGGETVAVGGGEEWPMAARLHSDESIEIRGGKGGRTSRTRYDALSLAWNSPEKEINAVALSPNFERRWIDVGFLGKQWGVRC